MLYVILYQCTTTHLKEVRDFCFRIARWGRGSRWQTEYDSHRNLDERSQGRTISNQAGLFELLHKIVLIPD